MMRHTSGIKWFRTTAVAVFWMTPGTGDTGPVASGTSAVSQPRVTINTVGDAAFCFVINVTKGCFMACDTGATAVPKGSVINAELLNEKELFGLFVQILAINNGKGENA